MYKPFVSTRPPFDNLPKGDSRPDRALKIFERDKWICQLCGKKLNPKLQATNHRDAPTIDHIIPLVKGGAKLRNNRQTACKKCNTKKGDTLL